MSNLRIALDFDGTLARSMEAWVEEYNNRYSKNITVNDIRTWNFENSLGISTVEKMEIFRKLWTHWRFIRPVEPYQYMWALELSRLGKMDVVTSILPDYIQYAEKWLMLHAITHNNIVHAGSNSKHEMDYDYFIDDNPEMAERMKHVPEKILLLFNQPWNQHVEETTNVKRIYGIEEAYNVIRLGIALKHKMEEEPDEDFVEDISEDWDDEDEEDEEDELE